MKTNATITVKHKQHPYTLEKKRDGTVHIVCKAARLNQAFLPEDVSELILDLPELIVAEEQYDAEGSVIRFRVSAHEKRRIEERAMNEGYTSVSEYLRAVAMAAPKLR